MKVLDVGCGNDSPRKIKGSRPDIFYIGLDINDYNITEYAKSVANSYIISTPETFASTICGISKVDAVISSQNLEHCDKQEDVLRAIMTVLKPKGRLYLSFPCEQSVSFPHRSGCLNFYDDKTHKAPVRLKHVLSLLADNMTIDYVVERARPCALKALGYMMEPVSKARQVVMPGTWERYGFETIIWATRRG